MIREGRVASLGPGLDACRSGDVATVRMLVECEGWRPADARDRNGSGPLVWAAGGGHLMVRIFSHVD